MKQPSSKKLILAASLLLALCTQHASAASGTWTNLLNGNWSDPANWLNGIVADNGDGIASTANFATIDVPYTTNINVTLDGTVTNQYNVANILFGDANAATNSFGSWSIVDGGVPLVLDNSSDSNSIIDVTLSQGLPNNWITFWGAATITANIGGTNNLVKTGPNRLILNPSSGNTYSGATIISNGIIEIGAGKNSVALNLGPVIFYGGGLRLSRSAIPGSTPNSNTGDGGYPYSVIVPDGQTGTIYMTPYATGTRTFGSGTVSGGGTLNLWVDYVRDNLAGDWSNFTGKLVVASSPRSSGNDFRLDSTFVPSSWSNNAVVFTNNGINGNAVFMYNPGLPVGTVVEIGELSATLPGIVNIISASTTVNNGGGNSAPFVLQVGALNTDSAFSGNFNAGNGSVGIIKVGTGTWTLTGTNVEYTGMTVIQNGTLQIGNATSGKLGRSAVVTNNAALAFGRTDSGLVVTNVIDGPGVVIQRGGGRTTLAPSPGANTYSGQTLVTNGTLAVSSQSAFGAVPASYTANQIVLNGGALAATATTSFSDANRGFSLGADGGLMGADGANTLTVSGVIAGTGNLIIANTGTVVLMGANTYSGKTILQSGTLALSSESPLGSAPVSATPDQLTFDGGTLNSTATFSISAANRGISIGASGATVSPNAGTTLTLSEPIVGSGPLTKVGAGTLTINGADSHTGNVMINVGTLVLGASGSISASPLISVASGATLDVSAAGITLSSGQTLGGNGTVIGNVSVPTGGNLNAGTSVGNLTINGNLTLSGGTDVVEISSSTNDVITVAGNLSLSGLSTINLDLLSSLPVGTYSLIKYGGSLVSGSVANLSISGYPPSRLTAMLVHNAGTKSIDLVITGTSASLVWDGGANGNAWDVIATTNWLKSGVLDFFYNGDTVTFDNTGAANANVNLTVPVAPAAAIVNSSTDYTFSGVGKLTGISSLNKSGTDKLIILTTNDYEAGTTINGGTVQVGNGTASGSLGSGSVLNNSALAFNVPGTLGVSNAISGSGSVSVQGGTVILAANNSYGSSAISSGATLQVGAGGSTGSLGTGAVSDNGALVYKRSGSVTNSASISGGGSLSVQGSGTVALAANNSYAGPTTVDTGVLQIGVGGTAGTLGTAGAVTLTNGATLAFSRSDVVTNFVTIIGTNGTLAQYGPGTVVIPTDGNNWGPTLVTGGILQIGNGNDMTGSLPPVSPVTVSGNGTLTFARPDVITVSNVISGTGNVVYEGRTNVIVMAVNGLSAYSGTTTISNSYITLTATASSDVATTAVNQNGFGSSTINIAGNSGIEMAAATNVDVGGGGSGNFANPINVAAGQTLAIYTPGRFEFSSAVSGAGTINYGATYVRGNVTGSWTNFYGTLNVVTNSVNTNIIAHDFRMFNTGGFPNARVSFDNTSLFWRGTAGAVVPIGELTGTETAFIGGTGGAEGGNAVTWVIGGLNTDSTFDGTISGSVAVNVAKAGTGKWTFTGTQSNPVGAMIVSNGVLALSTNSVGVDASVLGIITVANPGVLNVSRLSDNTLHVNGVLDGDGTVQGGVYNGATIAPGFSTNVFGNLTITSNLVSDGFINFKVDHVTSAVSDKVTAPSLLVNGSISVTQVSTNDLVTGDVFQLFSGPVTGNGTNSVNLPFQNFDGSIVYVWTNKLYLNGTVELLVGGSASVNSTPTNIVVSVSGNQLTLSWPADHTGWRLQVQTNSLSTGLGTNWMDVTGSTSVNSVNVPINTANGSVFYRMVYP